MPISNDLIDLFAEYTVKELEDNNGRILKDRFAVGSVEELTRIDGYTDSFALIRECKVELERLLARKPKSSAREVVECLEILEHDKQYGPSRRVEAFRDLVRRSIYASGWTPQDRQTFDDRYEVIMDWRYYFLSYTNRDAQATNNTFRKLIKFAYHPTRGQWTTANVVARIIAKLFTQNNVLGFFDYDDIKSGDDIGDTIRQYCRGCWAFVQIVEPSTFATPPAGTVNWCFEEYDEFEKATARLQALVGHNSGKRFHFVITLDGIKELIPVLPNPNYNPWFNRARALHCKSLSNKEYAEVREIVREMASRMAELRKSIVADLLQRPE